MLVMHPETGQRCRPAEALKAEQWARIAVCVHGDLVVCGECGELGILPRPGLGHIMELLPEGATVADAQELMQRAAETPAQPPAEATASAEGEDRSAYQSEVSWHPNKFGFAKATESTNFTDSTFAYNWAKLASEGIPRGAYHYFHPSVSPVDQAHHFVSVITSQGKLRDDDLLAADIEILVGADGTTLEFSSSHAAERSHLSGPDLGSVAHGGVIGSAAKVFIETVQSLTGHRMEYLLTYTDLSVAAFLGPVAGLGSPLWISYPASSFPKSVYPWTKSSTRFWQWSFGGGAGGGDRDAFMGDEAALQQYLGGSPSPQARPPHIWSKTGEDEGMFYLPNGDGAEVTADVPDAVPGVEGDGTPGFVVPGHLALNAQGSCSVHLTWNVGGTPGTETAEHIDWDRTPNKVRIPDGAWAVKLRREKGVNDPVVVTASWRA